MLNRRASASGGHVGIASPNPSSTRIHRTNESLHGFTTPVPPNAPYNANSTPQQKVVHTLVNRLKNRASGAEQHCLSIYIHTLFQLPVHSGVNLCQVEADEALQQAIETLVDLSHDSVDVIAWAIAELLDKFAKVRDGCLLIWTFRGLINIECPDIGSANTANPRTTAVSVDAPQGTLRSTRRTVEGQDERPQCWPEPPRHHVPHAFDGFVTWQPN